MKKSKKSIKLTIQMDIEDKAGIDKFAYAMRVLADNGFQEQVKQFVQGFITAAEEVGFTDIPADLREYANAAL